MIPVTTFAGKPSRYSGSAARGWRAAMRSGPAGRKSSPATMTPSAWRRRRGGLHRRRPPPCPLGKIAALVLSPGVPLTHPMPHWTVGLARAAAVEVIGDIELFCRERGRTRRQAPFVAITGTNGKSTTTALTGHILRSAGHDVQLGGNIGTAILSLEPPRRGPGACDRGLVLSDRSRALARSFDRNSAQCQRGPHRPPRHAGKLCRRQGAAGGGRAGARHRDRRRRRQLVCRGSRPSRSSRQAGGADIGAPAALRWALCRGRADPAGRRRHRAFDCSARRASVRSAGCTTLRMPPAPPARRWRSTSRRR